MIEYYAASAVLSFVVTLAFTWVLIGRLTRAGITGNDENKPNKPLIPEMGGIAIVAGLSAGLLLAIFFSSFLSFQLNLAYVLAAIITIHTIAFIGIIDDLLDIPQWLKALMPLFAAIPLIAVKVGTTAMTIPFIGTVDFGVLYILVLVPLAVAVCSNLTNMLAGFNGMEAGMGSVIFGTMSVVAIANGSTEMALVSLSMFGALLAFLAFNIHPAKIFPGDVGTLTIGCTLAAAVIIGNLESAGVILVVPYVFDFFVKAMNRFPHTHQDIRNGKLYPKGGKVNGLVHVVMKAFNGISEQKLVIFFVGVEALFAIVVLALHVLPRI